MFDDAPFTSNSRAAGANSITEVGQGMRRNIVYIGDVWDPDTMPADDISKYVVPKEGWLVWALNGSQLQWYYVYKVYQNKSELKPCMVVTEESDTTEDQDTIFGSKGGPLAGEGIMGIDYSVRPPRATIDSTIMRPGATHAYLFLGENLDLDNGAKIISAVYDASNNLTSNKIPVVLAAINNYTNNTIFNTDVFSVVMGPNELPNGTRCTLVFFNGEQPILPSQRIVIQQNSYLRNRELGVRYVTDIELISPWFTDSNDPDKIVLPITTPLSGIVFEAGVHYTNGDTEISPVNGGRFQLLGTDEFRPSYPGQRAELTLVYTLADDELFYIANPGVNGRKARVYDIVAGDVQGAYAPKLYTYPYWVSAGSQYGLMHWLYDLDRKTFINVTDYVRINEISPPFKPKSYNAVQTLIFNLTLKDVSPSYNSTIIKQTTAITLFNDINGPGRRWGVQFEGASDPYVSLFAKTVNNNAGTTVNLTNGFTTVDDWLKALYWSVIPSFDIFNEEKAPTPTKLYFMLADGTKWPITLTNWNKPLNVGVNLQNGQTAFLCWVAQDGTGNESQLAMTGVVIDTTP